LQVKGKAIGTKTQAVKVGQAIRIQMKKALKILKLLFVVFGILLFGCNQPRSKNMSLRNNKSVDTANNGIPKKKSMKAMKNLKLAAPM
jgi:hypothetical protein